MFQQKRALQSYKQENYLITCDFGDTFIYWFWKIRIQRHFNLAIFSKVWNTSLSIFAISQAEKQFYLLQQLRSGRADCFPRELCQAFHFYRIPQLFVNVKPRSPHGNAKFDMSNESISVVKLKWLKCIHVDIRYTL